MSIVRSLGQLDRAELAVLARELLLAGQLMDRAGMPHVISAYGRQEMGDIAIDEWMGASPVYTRRTQRLLGFAGDTIDTMFKGLQLDIGAPPEFMDFRLRVIDDHHGEFWLDHCGALMDVEPMGEDYVRTMCHTIEDPTFDATAMATSPYAQIRPVHRPPRTPEGRHPHCHWTATIDPSRSPLPEPEPATHIATTRLAQLPVPAIEADVAGSFGLVSGADFLGDIDAESSGAGWSDYTAPMDPDLRLEQFSAAALRGLVHEIAVQSHLLVMSFLFAIERRHGLGAATEIGRQQLSGIAGLTAERLRDACGLDRSLAAVAQVLALHPLLQPRDYVAATVSFDESAASLRIGLSACPALEENHLNWLQLLVDGNDEGLTTLVQGVDLRHGVERVDPSGDEVAAWQVVTADQPARESRLVALTRFSTGADFRFTETPVALRDS